MSQSEVAQLLESIRLSYEAAQLVMHGPTMIGGHEFITKRMEQMHEAHTELQTLVGSEEAIKLLAQTLECVEPVKKPQVES